MNRFRACLASPLARRPELLRRKIAERLHLRGPPVLPAMPPFSWRPFPDSATARLRAWVRSCDVHDDPLPAHRVFRRDFEPALLAALCREGPARQPDLTGDVKLIWDYGRGHAFALNALRGVATAAEIAEGIRRWLDQNQDRAGAAWTSAMDAALRAVNWIAADAALAGGLAAAFGAEAWKTLLWEHACRVEHGLEVRLLTTNNHYLAELLGLAWLGAHFADSPQGRHWCELARAEMATALLAQTRGDGGLNEASLPYHVLATEMALLFLAVQSDPMPAAWMDRLQKMVEITAHAGSARGEVYQVGDSDGGRVLPLEFVSRTLGHAAVVTRLASAWNLHASPSPCAIYRESGWAMLRWGPAACHLEFGGWGPHGLAGHAHNDTLSLCVDWNGAPLLVDPGSYLYTPDPAARNLYRSTAAHNTVQFDGREQVSLPPADRAHVFVFRGPREPCRILASGEQHLEVENRCAADGTDIRHVRRLQLTELDLRVSDTVAAPPGTQATWRFHLAPQIDARPEGDRVILSGACGRIALTWSGPELKPSVEDSEVCPYYGTRTATRCLRFDAIIGTPRTFDFRWQSA